MENHQSQESAPSRSIQQLDSPSHELKSHSSNEQTPTRPRSANRSPPPLFPQDILVEILQHLPVKSLLRFRCVSKSWDALVTEPFIIKNHLKRSKIRVLLQTKNTRNQTEETQYSFKTCSLNAIYNEPILIVTENEYLSNQVCHDDLIVGSYDGLICVARKEEEICLLNPTLRVFKSLPDLGFKKKRGRTIYGFGFDSSVDDYKVVICHQSKGPDGYEGLIMVYSLRTNCWRRITQDFPFSVPSLVGNHLDGSLNWVIYVERDTGFTTTLISLDLAHETLKELTLPNYDVKGERILGVVDGCLCLLCEYGRLYCEVWVMKEYGNSESWTKLVTIPHMPFSGSELLLAPLFVSERGEVLFHLGTDLITYNPKEKWFRIHWICHDAIVYVQQVVLYVESLVSPTQVNQQ